MKYSILHNLKFHENCIQDNNSKLATLQSTLINESKSWQGGGEGPSEHTAPTHSLSLTHSVARHHDATW